MFSRLTIKKQLILGFGLVTGVMFIATLILYNESERTRHTAEHILDQLNPQIKASHDLFTTLVNDRSELRLYFTTGNQQYLNAYNRSALKSKGDINTLRDRLSGYSQQIQVFNIESNLKKIRLEEARAIQYVQRGNRRAAIVHHAEYVDPVRLEVLRSLSDIAAIGHAQIELARDNFYTANHRMDQAAVMSCITVALIALMSIIFTVRSIARPSKAIMQAAESLSQGNYSPAITLHDLAADTRKFEIPRNELQLIALSVGQMAKKLYARERTLLAHRDLSTTCASSINVKELLNSALIQLADYSNSQIGIIYLFEGKKLVPVTVYGTEMQSAAEIASPTEGLVQQAAGSRQMIVLRDLPEDTRITIYPGFGEAMPKSVVYLPLILRGKTLGIIMLASLFNYDSYLAQTLEAFAVSVSIALGNAISHTEVRELAQELEAKNQRLDAQNEELQAQNEEICAQAEEIQAQNEELQVQNLELAQKSEDIERHALELEEKTQDLMALQSIITVALSSIKLDDLLRGMLETVTELTGAEFGLIALLNDSRDQVVPAATHNLYTAEIRPLPITQGLAEEVISGGAIVYSRDCISVLGEQAERYHPNCALAGIPIKVGNRFYGVAFLGFPDSREVTKKEYNLLNIFSSRCAIAVDRAQAYQQMEQAEKRALADHERLQAIIDNLPQAVIIANGPDGRVYTANKIALQLCGVDLIPAAVFKNHTNAFNLCKTNGEPAGWKDLPLYRSYHHGETRVGDELLVIHPDGRQITILINSVPLRDSDGAITGSIAVFQDITAIKAQQKLLVEGYEQQRNIAETLQKTFLPNIRPILPNYDIADIYVPAHIHEQVGGDLYDIITLDEGRIGLVIADVSGKGVEAAVHTAMAKYMLRAFAHENPNPGSVIKRLNDAMVRYISGEIFVTLFYGILDTKKRELRYVNAGHELPLIYNTLSNSSTLLKTTGPATGILADALYREEFFQLKDQDAILLYTDGITESRKDGAYFGIDGLSKTVADIKDLNATDMAETILNKVKDYSGGTFHDDVALLLIKPVTGIKKDLITG